MPIPNIKTSLNGLKEKSSTLQNLNGLKEELLRNAKTSRKSESEKSSTPHNLNGLKEELLMLSLQQQNKEKQPKTLFELDLAVPASDSFNDRFETVTMDMDMLMNLPSIEEDDDSRYAEDDRSSDCIVSKPKEEFSSPPIMEFSMPLVKSASSSMANRSQNSSERFSSRPRSYDIDGDTMSVSSSLSSMARVSTLSVTLVKSKAKLVAAKAKGSAAKSELVLAQKIENMRVKEETFKERRQEEKNKLDTLRKARVQKNEIKQLEKEVAKEKEQEDLAELFALKEAKKQEKEKQKEAAKKRVKEELVKVVSFKEEKIQEKENEKTQRAEATRMERQLKNLKKAKLAKFKAEWELEQVLSECSKDSGRSPKEKPSRGSKIGDEMRDDVDESLEGYVVKSLKGFVSTEALEGIQDLKSEKIEEGYGNHSWLGWLMGSPESCCGSSCGSSSAGSFVGDIPHERRDRAKSMFSR